MRPAVLFLASAMILSCGYGSGYNGGTPMPGTSPSVTEIVPDHAVAGSPGFMLTVNGTDFASGAVVYWNGAPLTTSYVTGKQILAAVPTANVITAGTIPVYARLGTVNSNMVNFTIQ